MIMIQALRRGDYPQFVVKNGFSAQPPVFYYHQVDPAIFRAHLDHLQRNGYFTLTADEYYQLLRENRKIDPKAVVLTFDDGLEDLFTVAYPLLKSYGFKAVAFIIPEWISRSGMITWNQAAEMHGSRVIDIQSHSLSHMSMFTSEEVVDFFRGNYKFSPPWGFPVVRREGKDRPMNLSDLGSPIFSSASRLSDSKRYFPDQNMERACIEAVSQSGGKQFFGVKDWRSRLLKIVHQYRTSNRSGRYEQDDEQKDAIKRELTLSRRRIEERLSGKAVKHFAFPWSKIGNLTTNLLAECGYESAYGGLPTTDLPYTGPHPYRINRVNADFILRLPGKGQQSLMRIIFDKSTRRLAAGSTY
jgi:peptidoglycan/xylan/chitin deacetylase (PgdA/CDA1 family)